MSVSKGVLVAIVTLAGFGSSMAQAQGFGFASGGRTYVAATFGQGDAASDFSTSLAPLADKNDDDKGMFAAATIGRDLGRYRFELEFASRKNEGETGATSPCPSCDHSVTVHALMINGLVDFPLGETPITFSAGAGIGVAGVMHNIMGEEATDSFSPAGQALAQISYALNDRIEIFGDARYFKTLNEAPVSDSMEFGAYSSKSFGLGVRFSF